MSSKVKSTTSESEKSTITESKYIFESDLVKFLDQDFCLNSQLSGTLDCLIFDLLLTAGELFNSKYHISVVDIEQTLSHNSAEFDKPVQKPKTRVRKRKRTRADFRVMEFCLVSLTFITKIILQCPALTDEMCRQANEDLEYLKQRGII